MAVKKAPVKLVVPAKGTPAKAGGKSVPAKAGAKNGAVPATPKKKQPSKPVRKNK